MYRQIQKGNTVRRKDGKPLYISDDGFITMQGEVIENYAAGVVKIGGVAGVISKDLLEVIE